MFFDNFLKICEEKGVSPSKAITECGFNKSAVTYWKKEDSMPKVQVLQKLADYFGVSVDYLLNGEDETPSFENIFQIETKKVPLLGDIACGEPIWADEQYGEFVSVSDDLECDFCLRAKGDSMIGARIYDGDIVFIRKQETVNNGEIAAVIIDNEATLKRVYWFPEEKKLILNAENPAFTPFVFVGAELENVRIIGKAVAFQSLVK